MLKSNFEHLPERERCFSRMLVLNTSRAVAHKLDAVTALWSARQDSTWRCQMTCMQTMSQALGWPVAPVYL